MATEAMPTRRKQTATAAVVVAVPLAVFLPVAMTDFHVFLLSQTLVFGIALFGLVIVAGLLGQPSLMHAELMGLGAAVTATLVQAYGWNYWSAAIASVITGYAAGLVLGLPALRIRGLALAIVTLAIAQTFDQLVLPSTLLSGTVGSRTIPRPTLGPFSLSSDRAFYQVTLAVFLAALWLVLSIRRGKLGRMFTAIRESEKGAAASGASLTRYKLLGFAASAGFAAVAGALYVGLIGSYTAAPYDWLHSIVMLAMLSIMGSATVSGSIMAAFTIIDMPQILQQVKLLDQLTQFTSGLTLIIQTIMAPEGAIPMTAKSSRRLAARVKGWMEAAPETQVQSEGDPG
ncbi:MAG: branched-chain amino acid ABC transporter permease [Actinomycetota bacterium]